MSQTIVAVGAAHYPVLPSYKVSFTVRDRLELVQKGDYLCFGGNVTDLSSWTRIHPDSAMIGQPANTFTDKPIGFKLPIE